MASDVREDDTRLRKWKNVTKKMLSVRVADWLVTPVGLEINGKNEADINVSINSFELFWELHFMRSILKSPIRNVSLIDIMGFCTKSCKTVKKIIQIRTRGPVNYANHDVFSMWIYQFNKKGFKYIAHNTNLLMYNIFKFFRDV